MSIVEKSFKNGEVIVKEGDSGNSFFQIIDGSALVYAESTGKDDQIKLATLEPGAFFGEMAILEAYPRSASVIAKGNVTAIEIPGDELNSFFEEDPNRINDLMMHLANGIEAMTVDYEEAKNLLSELRKSEEAKKNKSLFAKIKKHIDMYQSNKNTITEPDTKELSAAIAALKDDGYGSFKAYRKGMILFKEGEIGDTMYILKNGTVGMYTNYRKREEEKVGEAQAVTFIGEIGMITDKPRKASAVSESDDTNVEIIYKSDLETIFRSQPEKIILILRYLSYRLRRLNNDFLGACKEITEIYNKK